MKSRAWFEKHGYMRQVRFYDAEGLMYVAFPANVTRQRRIVRTQRKRGFLILRGKSRFFSRIVVWAPEGDQKIEVS